MTCDCTIKILLPDGDEVEVEGKAEVEFNSGTPGTRSDRRGWEVESVEVE